MFREANAKFHAEHYAKTASTAFTVGMLVAHGGSGYVRPANETDTQDEIVGICKEDVSASDATTDKILISVPEEAARFECDDVDGTITAAKVGNTYDLTDSNSANVGASTVNVVRLLRMVSATKGVFKLNK